MGGAEFEYLQSVPFLILTKEIIITATYNN